MKRRDDFSAAFRNLAIIYSWPQPAQVTISRAASRGGVAYRRGLQGLSKNTELLTSHQVNNGILYLNTGPERYNVLNQAVRLGICVIIK
ncbi:hypothetical protein HZ326_2037 [Fusarium oxysporum f. sp. albedinis]|nr:hypothetical protein HZ326_2037 [Fusarium oxysporum f. sp. albedinis]